jgi:predicted chitinase
MIEETGIGIKNPLWFVGVVEGRDDPRKEGRVQVRAFGLHGTNAQVPPESLPWAICISGNYDPNYPIPPLNSWVFGFFMDGRDAQQPMILGLIPTQMTGLIDPEANGWGVIPTSNVNLHSQGSRAIDYGQPQNSALARGEDTHKTSILFQEVNRLSADFSSIEEGFKIEEPSPGYCAVYPHNRVIETACGHSIELDDSPGAERIRIWHTKGSYVEMHQSGVVVVKAANDLWLGSEGHICIVSKSRQLIKVEGDAVMSVDGNMALEVKGDMQQIVRGNYELSVGGQLNLNGSEEIQARAAKVRIESNVESINLKSSKQINIQSGEVMNIRSEGGILQQAVGDINIKGENLFVQGTGDTHIKSKQVFLDADGNMNIKGKNLFVQGTENTNIKSTQVFLDASGNMNIKAAYTKIGNGQISLNGTSVAIDEFVYLASGESVTAPGGTDATAAEEALPAFPAEGTELPEPAEKSSGNGNGSGSFMYGHKNIPLSGGSGAISQDDYDDNDNIPVVSSSYVKGDYTDLEEGLRAQGFTENEILATLAVSQNESTLDWTKTENSYLGTPNSSIRVIFSTRTGKLSDAEIDNIKTSDTTFFNYIYGGTNGNSSKNDDGYNFRGKSYIQLTYKANYEKIAKITGYDIVNNPDLIITNKSVAIACCAAYLNANIGTRSDDPVADIRGAVAGSKTNANFKRSIDKDRAVYAKLLKERGTLV